MASSKDEKEREPAASGRERTTAYGAPDPSQATTDWDLTELALRPLRERYELLGELGRGGMGIVYRARDRETGDVVALKVLQPDIAQRPEVIERFKAELLLARKITHKNVCRTYELLRFGETAAIAMEYVEGESLRTILRRPAGVSLRSGLEWVRQICSALAEAHARGVVHRDLKPENILIDRKGQAKVMDFGIARSLESDATRTGTLIGTPAYMSPEQVEGKPPDARSDIYSLGLILYEMFTGECPFRADTPVAAALKRLHEAPPPARTIEPDLPERIDRALQRCLDKDPKKRFQSVAELEAALQRRAPEELAAGEEAPGTALRWGPPWTQKTEVRFLLAAAIFILLLASTWIFSKEGFLMFLLVLAAGVAAVFTWPSWRVLPASIWAGLALGFLTWLVAALVIWKEAPLLMRFAQAGASPTRLTQFMLTVCSFVRIMYPVTALFIQLMALFGRQKEKAEFRRVMSNQLLGLILIVGNVVLAALIVYSVLLLPLL